MSATKELVLRTLPRADEAEEEQRLDQLDRAWDDDRSPLTTPLRPLVHNGELALDYVTSAPLYQVAAGFPHEGARGTRAELEALIGGPVHVPHPDLGYDLDTGEVLSLVLGRWCIARNLLHHDGHPLLLEDRCEGLALVALVSGETIATWPARPVHQELRSALAAWSGTHPQREEANWPPTSSHAGLVEGN